MTLETLELSAEQLMAARNEVREMAYLKWCAAGKPECDGCQYWVEAEKEWIGRNYVPWRAFEMDSDSLI